MAWLTEAKRLNRATGKKEPYFAIQWREGGKTSTKGLGFVTSSEARQLLKVAEGKLAAGESLDPPPTASGSAREAAVADVPTLGRYLDDVYLPVVKRDKAPKTARSAETAANAVKAKLGALALTAVDFKSVDAYFTARKDEGRRSRTIAIELWLLRGCLQHAADCKVIDAIPRLPTVRIRDRKPHRFLTPEQSVKLLEALRPLDAQPHVVTRGAPPVTRDRLTYLAVLMALNLGMRKGEILSRAWSDVRWAQGKNGALLVGSHPEIGFEVKTRRERTVPLTPDLRAELLAANAEADNSTSGWIFPSPGDASKPRKDFGIALKRACRRSGLPVVHPHALRHTWASRLAMQGVDRRTLMELGGWSSGSMLDHVYAHSTDEHMDEVMDRSGLGSRHLK
ncbi:MAG: tyrosine-type recombinase/integrase [Myxococcota bacterium]